MALNARAGVAGKPTTTSNNPTAIDERCGLRDSHVVVVSVGCSWLVWPGGAMVRAMACDSKNREFNSRPFRCQVTTWASCSQACVSVTKQYNLVAIAAQRCPVIGKVTVGLASQWPCVTVTDLSGLSTCGLKAYVRDISTRQSTLLMRYGTLYLYLGQPLLLGFLPPRVWEMDV